jgi:hypothetical protein
MNSRNPFDTHIERQAIPSFGGIRAGYGFAPGRDRAPVKTGRGRNYGIADTAIARTNGQTTCGQTTGRQTVVMTGPRGQRTQRQIAGQLAEQAIWPGLGLLWQLCWIGIVSVLGVFLVRMRG